MENNNQFDQVQKRLSEQRIRQRLMSHKADHNAEELSKRQKEAVFNLNYKYGKFSLSKYIKENLQEYVNQIMTKEKLKQIVSNSVNPTVLAILEQMVSTFRYELDDRILDITDYTYILEQYDQLFHKVTLNVSAFTSCLDIYANILTNDVVLVFRMEIDEKERYFLITETEFVQFVYDLLKINKVIRYTKVIEIPIDDVNSIQCQYTISKGFKDKHIKIRYDECKNVVVCFNDEKLRNTLFYTIDLIDQMVRNINHILAEYYALQEVK
jgi:hypothetical protein